MQPIIFSNCASHHWYLEGVGKGTHLGPYNTRIELLNEAKFCKKTLKIYGTIYQFINIGQV